MEVVIPEDIVSIVEEPIDEVVRDILLIEVL